MYGATISTSERRELRIVNSRVCSNIDAFNKPLEFFFLAVNLLKGVGPFLVKMNNYWFHLQYAILIFRFFVSLMENNSVDFRSNAIEFKKCKLFLASS